MLYKLKEEFFKEHNITEHQWKRRKEELLEWLKEFYNYKIIPGNPLTIEIIEEYGKYRPLPRKKYNPTERQQQKKKDYEIFTIAALGAEFKPNSKSKISRDAIDSFGYEKYGHLSQKKVAERYVKEPFDKNAETNGNNVWVYYDTYRPMSEEVVEKWRMILREEKIGEQEAANAFYRQEQGEDVSVEKGYYKKAVERFQREYHGTPVLVKEWRLNQSLI